MVDGKPLPSNTATGSIWGTSSSNVFATAFYQDLDENAQIHGSHSLLLHYDGSAWTTMVSQTPGHWFGDIWGSSSSDIYAFGLGLHYDGAAWTEANGLPSLIGDAWGSSSNDIYVCEGGGGLGVHGVIAHFDGTAWSTMVTGTTAGLAGIWGSSPTDVFVVGNGGTILRRSCTSATPDAFQFLDRTGAAPNRTVSAAGIQVVGICSTAPISVSGGEYSINGGGYTSAPGMVNNGSTVSVRTVSAGTHATTSSATLTIGNTSDAFSVTTQGARGETRKKNDFDGDGRSEIGCYEPASGT